MGRRALSSLGNGHAGSCRRAADIGVGRQDDVFQIEAEQLAADKAKQHVDDDHEEAEGKEQGRVRRISDIDAGTPMTKKKR